MDTIADMIVRMRNALRAKKEVVEIPSSRIKKEIARILKDEGYISNYKVFDNGKAGQLKILFRYTQDKEPVLSDLRRVSKPSRRIYRGWEELGDDSDGFSVAIVSTSKGIMTDRQARQMKVGGEVLARVL